MKKITVIASLLVLFTACEKADIRPNATRNSEPTLETTRAAQASRPTQASRSAADPNGGSEGGDPGTLGTGTTTTGPGAPSPDPTVGEITDPLRKKDQKDNK